MILFLGFLVSSFAATQAMAECQDGRCRIVSLTGELEIPVVGDLKSFTINREELNQPGGIIYPGSLS